MTKLTSKCAAVCLLALGLTLTGCAKDEDSGEATSTAASTAMKPAAAGSSASAPVAPGDQIGASTSAPQGDCPEGFACTRVLFPENERVCMKPGETLAPACDASDKCPEVPKAECIDTGTTGKLCTQFCKV